MVVENAARLQDVPRALKEHTFCKGHGGGKRCAFQGGGVCTKSVQADQLRVAHGGGKRCAVPECTKSARGRTDFCVRHGGGKRCKFEGCDKSAQGSTDFWVRQVSVRSIVDWCRIRGFMVVSLWDPPSRNPKLASLKMKEVVIAEDMNVDIVKMGPNLVASASKTTNLKTFGVPNAHSPVGEPGCQQCQSSCQKAGCMVAV
ncbi:hypothetical protein GH714_004912 [Hevea brasiliensis]|uniref:WRKY19-like zinc finger domain-containing protein n=1 Tax=Hevea brasiliensis TaxID=3981 RepID=A0A6A6L8X4_HEVBR|nr:hypothetical protein GH714_004912 [Hevea brasiliensis]